MANPPAAPGLMQLIRANASDQESFVLFVNTTQRSVNLYWIDYNGRQTFQLTLAPRANTKVNTYRWHPWIFRDHRTGERMQVAHENTFWPQPYFMRDPRNLGQWIPCRKQISIHFPVRALRETLLWRVVSALTNVSNAAAGRMAGLRGGAAAVGGEIVSYDQQIERLCLPLTLKTDLRFVLRAIENHRVVGPTTGR